MDPSVELYDALSSRRDIHASLVQMTLDIRLMRDDVQVSLGYLFGNTSATVLENAVFSVRLPDKATVSLLECEVEKEGGMILGTPENRLEGRYCVDILRQGPLFQCRIGRVDLNRDVVIFMKYNFRPFHCENVIHMSLPLPGRQLVENAIRHNCGVTIESKYPLEVLGVSSASHNIRSRFIARKARVYVSNPTGQGDLNLAISVSDTARYRPSGRYNRSSVDLAEINRRSSAPASRHMDAEYAPLSIFEEYHSMPNVAYKRHCQHFPEYSLNCQSYVPTSEAETYVPSSQPYIESSSHYSSSPSPSLAYEDSPTSFFLSDSEDDDDDDDDEALDDEFGDDLDSGFGSNTIFHSNNSICGDTHTLDMHNDSSTYTPSSEGTINWFSFSDITPPPGSPVIAYNKSNYDESQGHWLPGEYPGFNEISSLWKEYDDSIERGSEVAEQNMNGVYDDFWFYNSDSTSSEGDEDEERCRREDEGNTIQHSRSFVQSSLYEDDEDQSLQSNSIAERAILSRAKKIAVVTTTKPKLVVITGGAISASSPPSSISSTPNSIQYNRPYSLPDRYNHRKASRDIPQPPRSSSHAASRMVEQLWRISSQQGLILDVDVDVNLALGKEYCHPRHEVGMTPPYTPLVDNVEGENLEGCFI